MTKSQAEMILLYAKHSMNARIVGKELYMTAQNMHYHLKLIHYETGLNPKNFYDLCRLVGIAASVKGDKTEHE
jgi:sugar diacid utilization regulator